MLDRLRARKETRPPPGEKGKPTVPDPARQRGMTIIWILASVALFYFLQGGFGGASTEEISLSRLFTLVDEGKVGEATISATSVDGLLEPETGAENDEDGKRFTTTLPPNYKDVSINLLPRLSAREA